MKPQTPAHIALVAALLFFTDATNRGAADEALAFMPDQCGHVGITRDALSGLEFTVQGRKLRFSVVAVNEIVAANVDTDRSAKFFGVAAHFDDERLEAASQRLIDRLNDMRHQLSGQVPSGLYARGHLGTALHTLQDFYSHSNWVLLHPETGAIESSLGFRTLPDPKTPGDNPCPDSPSSLRDGFPLLITGFFPFPNPCASRWLGTPRGRCRHGANLGPFDCEGLNRDVHDRVGHREARTRAVEATRFFVTRAVEHLSHKAATRLFRAADGIDSKPSILLSACGEGDPDDQQPKPSPISMSSPERPSPPPAPPIPVTPGPSALATSASPSTAKTSPAVTTAAPSRTLTPAPTTAIPSYDTPTITRGPTTTAVPGPVTPPSGKLVSPSAPIPRATAALTSSPLKPSPSVRKAHEQRTSWVVSGFAFGQAALPKDSDQAFREVYRKWKAHGPGARVRVQGHTDNRGSRRYNVKLSLQRASAARRALLALGVPHAAIDVEPRAFDDPSASNATEEGRSINRRVAIDVGG